MTALEIVKQYLPPDHGFTDEFLTQLLSDNSNNVKLAAADALEAYASRKVADLAFAAQTSGNAGNEVGRPISEIRLQVRSLREEARTGKPAQADSRWAYDIDPQTGKDETEYEEP
ncbi:MAG: hypothetical protein ACYC9Q_14175 [Bacillota bacterium]